MKQHFLGEAEKENLKYNKILEQGPDIMMGGEP